MIHIVLYLNTVAAIYCLFHRQVVFTPSAGWVGGSYDRTTHHLFIFLVPAIGVTIDCRPLLRLYVKHWKYRYVTMDQTCTHAVCCELPACQHDPCTRRNAITRELENLS